MTLQETLKLISDSGLGLASFAALLFFGYKAGVFAKNFVENHLRHLQDGIDKLVEGTERVNEKLDRLLEK